MNNLFVLFNEKSRFLNLLHHQITFFFHWLNASIISRLFFSQTRITLYFKSLSNDQKKHEIRAWKTRENNHTIWALFCLHISKLFDFVECNQSKFTNFKERENVKLEIVTLTHDFVFSKNASLCEKIIDFAFENASFLFKIKSFKNDYFQVIYDDLTSTRLFIKHINLCCYLSSSFYFLNCSRVCRICHKTFDFNNALHKYLKNNHRNFAFLTYKF